ncbi:MAG: transcriptional repressor [Leptospira sp.]|nr:transcriptional repressor [Leptospira sp.]
MQYDSLKSEDSKISFATVYNSLEFLVSNGYVKKLDLDCDSARFDALLENHSHLVCNRCGEVIDVPAMAVPESDFLQKFDFTPEEISITIRGICRHCRSN